MLPQTQLWLQTNQKKKLLAIGGAALFSAAILVPLVLAQSTNPTASPDVIVDASILRTESYDADADGVPETVTNVALVTTPPGGAIRARAAIDLTLSNISVSGGSGYGYTGGESTITIVNATSGATVTGGVASVYNGFPGFVNATFAGITFNGPGIYYANAGPSTVAVLFVHPSDDLSVGISPPAFTYTTSGVAHTINVTNATGGVEGVSLRGFNLPNGATTLSSGSLTTVGPLPGAGTFTIQASLTNAGTQTFGGVQLPDVRNNLTVTVAPQPMNVTRLGAAPTLGTQDVAMLRPSFNDLGQPMLQRTAASPMRADWTDATDFLNVTVTTPSATLRVNLTNPSSILPVNGSLDLLTHVSCVSGPCGSLVPRIFRIDTTSGDLLFAPGEDDGPLSDVWREGTYTFRFEANTAGGTATQEEYAGTFALTATSPTLLVAHSPIMPSPAGSVTFFVNSSSGGPVGGADLDVRRNGVAYASLVTNVSGMASLAGLESGSYLITANATGYQDGNDSFSVNTTPIASRVVISNASGGPFNPVTVPIRLENFTDLGSITLNLTFNSSIVRIEDVTIGNVTGANLTWNVNNSTGSLGVLLTTSAIPGPSGDFMLMNVTLKAVGLAGGLSPLNLTTLEAVHSDGSSFGVEDVDGVFRSGLLGDVNVDNLVDATDVQLLSQHVVGLPVSIALANADTNRDERISGADAMFLSQYVAGTRTSL